MIGLKREEHWSFSNDLSDKNEQEFIATDGLSNENGNINKEMPQSKWKVDFRSLEKKSVWLKLKSHVMIWHNLKVRLTWVSKTNLPKDWEI